MNENGETMDETTFREKLAAIDIPLSTSQYEQFALYCTMLLSWNETMNLTAITERDMVFEKHFYDAAHFVKAVNPNHLSILDIGSGAGFPGIVLKILFPSIQLTIIDATKKRITFLQALCEALSIDVTLRHERAEMHALKNHYDIVTARAVAELNILVELCVPFVKVGGVFVAFKGDRVDEELAKAKQAVRLTGARIDQNVLYKIHDRTRSLLRFEKVQPTPSKYPRAFSKIKKSPL